MSEYWENYWNKVDGSNQQSSVGRTKFGAPVEEHKFKEELNFVENHLRLNKKDTLIDLCAGNGMLSSYLINNVSNIIAIDYSKPLLENFAVESANLKKVCANVKELDFGKYKYSKLIWYFSIQHFNEIEVTSILKNILQNLSKGGRVYIGDIPDLNKIWDFYSTEEYKAFYFQKLLDGQEHIGTWFEQDFFKNLLFFLGFENKFKIIEKPSTHFNSSYRFDLLIEK